jgi:hypothetical protein
MRTTNAMADRSPPPAKRDPGAPVGKDEIDPELVSLRGPRAKIGAISALAIFAVCAIYLLRLAGDFAFSRHDDHPRDVKVADVVAGNVGTDEMIAITTPLERSAAVRLRTGAGDPGVRVSPVVGADDKLWVALPGDGWEPAIDGRYWGRLHRFDSGPMGPALRDAAEAPQPRFVTGAELRRALATGKTGGNLAAITGPAITATGDTPIELDVIDPNAALVVTTYIERLKGASEWTDALAKAGVIAPGTAPATTGTDHAAWEVHGPAAVADAEKKLQAAQLWATRVDPVTVQKKAAWSQVASAGDQITIDGATLPWSAVDVAALWVARPLPDGAYVLVVDEKPSDYWAVKPLYIALAVLGLLFAWALWRAVRRDFWPLPK